jgi:hypothetical protein
LDGALDKMVREAEQTRTADAIRAHRLHASGD